MIYKKVSQEVGSTANELPKEKSKGMNGNFTNVKEIINLSIQLNLACIDLMD